MTTRRNRLDVVVLATLAAGSMACVDSSVPEDADARTASETDAMAKTPEAGPPADELPRFTAAGELLRPDDWESWVLAGTSMGLTYAENPRTFAPGEAPGSFLQVYIQPWAYEAFMEAGEFPEGTMFILAGSRPARKADPARGGFYQGDLHLMEVHLKQEGIDPSGWAFFGYGADTESAEQIAGDASCYSCHADNADHDNVFVQFYPRIRERLGMAAPAAGGPGPIPPAEGGADETAAATGEGG